MILLKFTLLLCLVIVVNTKPASPFNSTKSLKPGKNKLERQQGNHQTPLAKLQPLALLNVLTALRNPDDDEDYDTDSYYKLCRSVNKCRTGQICVNELEHREKIAVNKNIKDRSKDVSAHLNDQASEYDYSNGYDDNDSYDQHVPFVDLTKVDSVEEKKPLKDCYNYDDYLNGRIGNDRSKKSKLVNIRSDETNKRNDRQSFSTDYLDIGDLQRFEDTKSPLKKLLLQTKIASLNIPKKDGVSNQDLELQRKTPLYTSLFQKIPGFIRRTGTEAYPVEDEDEDDKKPRASESNESKSKSKSKEELVDYSEENKIFYKKYRKPKRFEVIDNILSKNTQNLPSFSKETEFDASGVAQSEELSIEVTTTKKPRKKKKSSKFEKKMSFTQGAGRFVKLDSDEYDYRRRLQHFLPKRYHWGVDDMQNLGYLWFNGPRGKYPEPWRINMG